MATSVATTKTSCHVRSISLPSRSHPLAVNVEDQLNRLRASEATSSSSPSIICQKVAVLKDLYECVDNLLKLPTTKQAFSHEHNNKCVDDVLDGSLRLLDVCSTTKDVISQMKDCVQDLESSFRRKNGGESSQADEIEKYLISRKKVNKMVRKWCSNLKRMRKCNLALLDQDRNLVATVSMLGEVEAASFTVFESLLSFVCPPKARSKSAGWSLIPKLIESKRVYCEEEANNVEKIDFALDALIRHKSSKRIDVIQVQNAQKGLEALERMMQELEDELECVLRCLIKTRVSLLNILNQ